MWTSLQTSLQCGEILPCAANDVSAVCADASEQHATVLALGRRMTLPQPIGIIAQDCCEVLARILAAELSSFTKLDDDGDSLTTNVFGTVNNATSSDTTSLKSSQSLASYTIRAACALTVTQLGNDPRFKEHMLSRLGVVGALVVPLQVDNQSVGVLGIYARKPREFSDAEISLTEMIGQMLALTMAWRNSESKQQRQAKTLDAVLDTASELVAVLDAKGHLKRTNAAFEALSGYGINEIRNRHFCDVFAVEDQASGMKEAIAQAASAQRRVFHESHLLDKHFNRRGMLWTVSPVIDEAEAVTELIVVGVDVRPVPEAKNAGGAQQRKADQRATLGRKTSPARQANGREKRIFPRKAFGWTQMIAVQTSNSLPNRANFIPVRCRDLSAGGISFFLDSKPQFRNIVVELGVPPEQKYMAAEIVRIEETVENGKTCYVAGCSFRGHL